MRRTRIYVDGFNFYYRAAKRYNLKWINLLELCKRKLHPDNEIVGIKYFTALVHPDSSDVHRLTRQQFYLRALRTIPDLEIIKGTFKIRADYRRRVNISSGEDELVKVILPEEKGSDVNLAAHLMDDAHRDRYDVAAIISNDSDLVGAISLAKATGKIVGVLCPSEEVVLSLERAASFNRMIEKKDLMETEFPQYMKDASGPFHRPKAWD